jgi:hypothetical protein
MRNVELTRMTGGVGTRLLDGGASTVEVTRLTDVTFWLVVRAVQATRPEVEDTLRRLRHGAEVGLMAFLVSLGMAFISPVLALLTIALVWSYWALRPGAASTPWSRS